MSHPQIKYCGNHSLQDLHYTVNSRADYIGVIFTPESKRCVSPREVHDWLKKCPLKNRQKLVGLFVNATVTDIETVLKTIPLDIIQCHGLESSDQIGKIGRITGLPVWKAIHHDESALERMRSYEGVAAGFIIDCKVKGQWGGTGKTFDWDSVPEYTKEAMRQGVPCFIAGGIRADNIGELLHYRPDGIDVSSGIEMNGNKDEQEIRRLEERMNVSEIELS